MGLAILDEYRNRLPQHGFGTDNLQYGLHFMAADELVKKRIIQHNPKHSIGWLVYDIDSETAMLDWQDLNAPPPNILVLNENNGHAHLFYGLIQPVHEYEGASYKALRYLAAVDVGLTDKLRADPNYTKLVSKNALHKSWGCYVFRKDLYTLDELAEWVNLVRDQRRRLPAVGLGRNCTLFHDLKMFAYRERRNPQQYLSYDLFYHTIQTRGLAINAAFPSPLPHSEVRSTARSVAKWSWNKMDIEGFKQWGDARRAKSIVTRKDQASELQEKIVKIKSSFSELNQSDIAAMLGICQKTVSNHLRGGKREPLSDITDY